MDMQKEREAFQEWFGTTTTYQTLWDFISTHQTNIKSVFVKKNGKTYQNDCVQIAWDAWQAAKSIAVPDGYCIVPKEPTRKIREAMYMAQHYHMSVINPDEWDAVDKSYKAMIEAAQEQNQ